LPKSSKLSLPVRFSNQNVTYISRLYHPCYMPHSSHPSWFDHSNNILWSVQVIKLLTMQSFTTFLPFLPVRSKFSLQYFVPKHPQSILFL
jgi:hypothetical protein